MIRRSCSVLSYFVLGFVFSAFLISQPGYASVQNLMDDAKASMPEKVRDTIKNRTWTRVAYTEATFKARGFTWGNNDPPALVQVPLSQPGLIWVIFYSNPQNSASAKHTGGGSDWSYAGHTIWGFRKPASESHAGWGRSESIYTFILKPHGNLKGFEAGIHATLDGKGAVGGDQRAGSHTLEILFSPDQPAIQGSDGNTQKSSGYQLYFDDKLVSGPDPGPDKRYTRQQAQENCNWNMQTKPHIKIRCVYNGEVLGER